MKTSLSPLLVLVAALILLVASVAYAVANATESGWGSGQMHRGAYGMMGSGGTSSAWYNDGRGPVRDIAAARGQAQRFADRFGLKTAEVMQFSNNFYVRLDDTTGRPATEVLVDPQTGAVTLEYGPAMMWNTRYGIMNGTSRGGMMGGAGGGGMMGGGITDGYGMMGRYGASPQWTPLRSGVAGAVSAASARQIANRWLASQDTRLTAGEPDAMPGYFTMETLRNGKVDGMLSVNVRTGAVWYHWWHGRFVTTVA